MIAARTWRYALALGLLAPPPFCGGPEPAHAQTTLARAPNVSDPWTGTAGTVRFHFIHRFDHSGPPARQVTSRPTFLLAYSLGDVLAGVQYATRSDVAAGVPNEWQPFARVALPAPVDGVRAGITVAYNVAAEAATGEAAATLETGRVRWIAAARAFGGDGIAGARVAAGGGAVARLGSHAAIAADAVAPLGAAPDTRAAWGVALQLAIPGTPHSLSLQAANTSSATLHGASRGDGRARYGFEFTLPITPARLLGRAARPAASAAGDRRTAGGVFDARIRDMAYRPDSIVVAVGTIVVWTNEDGVAHTVTADDGAFDSGTIPPGAVWAMRFDLAGRHPLYCAPHPSMRAVVVVR